MDARATTCTFLYKMWTRGGIACSTLRLLQPCAQSTYRATVVSSKTASYLRCGATSSPTLATRCLSTTSSLSATKDDAERDAAQLEMQERRRWLSNFQELSLRRSGFQVSFSRSSGPGGQNVNKLNTKANVRLDLSQAASHAPDALDASHPRKWLNRDLVSRIAKQSPYYVASDHSLLITSMRHRTQEANVQDALEKMHAHLLELAQDGLVGETSQQQRDRVRRLQQADARRKKHTKIKRADVKSGRKFKG